MRIFVEEFCVGVGGCSVEVEIVLFYIFAVVALVWFEAIQALFKNRIFFIPESEREDECLVVVAPTR